MALRVLRGSLDIDKAKKYNRIFIIAVSADILIETLLLILTPFMFERKTASWVVSVDATIASLNLIVVFTVVLVLLIRAMNRFT